ncbi:Fur family transcriptional regulator, peroxide stress response regulator [Ekhidna lutea]|uniref:Fur family transcriptional regulator, peroxide stress response regulator n=1 Tax=Ekhidna lutea TaxID=447679 RepID=A0A239JM26_EKHLU|nr:Fur family transcriptional regulator [Ekhidna lutea]SNT06885.1 Fur family transcriptional regulator, peroxide stress response regulator [Ekhidna lutea]
MGEISHIKEQLSEVGLKATHPRIVVLQKLMTSHDHPTAENIHETIKEDNPSISLGSVYRVLDVLVEAGLIQRVSVRSGSKRYDANMNPHGHIYCLKTNRIQDFYDEELYGLINEFFRKKKIRNFRINEIKLQVNGERIDPEDDVTII